MSEKGLDGFIEMQMEISDRHAAEILALKTEMEQQALVYQLKLEEAKRSADAEKNRLLAEMDRLITKIDSYDRFMEDYLDFFERSIWELARSKTPSVCIVGGSTYPSEYIAKHKNCSSRLLHLLLNQSLKHASTTVAEDIARHVNTLAEDLRLISELKEHSYQKAARLAKKNPNFKVKN